jgi:peroxiredoxin
MLSAGDLLPHFEATTVTGERFVYSHVWQRKNLLLVVLPAADRAAAVAYDRQLRDQTAAFCAADAVCIVTLDAVTGLSDRAVVIADRWGEIAHVATVDDPDRLPLPAELLEWVGYVQRRCPECEGETK